MSKRPTDADKLAAEAEHLLDGYLGLREKWALLEPALKDAQLVSAFDRSRRRGFEVLRRTFALSCAVDIANLCFDRDKDRRTPSISNVAEKLKNDNTRLFLRANFADRSYAPLHDACEDTEWRAVMKTERKRRRLRYEAQFDLLYQEFVQLTIGLLEFHAFEVMKNVRDKVAAHSELHLVNGVYRAVMLSDLGLEPVHFEAALPRLERAVELAQNLCRSSSFSWSGLDKQFGRMSRSFWGRARA